MTIIKKPWGRIIAKIDLIKEINSISSTRRTSNKNIKLIKNIINQNSIQFQNK